MKRTIIICLCAAAALSAAAGLKGIIKPDKSSGDAPSHEYVYPDELLREWRQNPAPESRWRLVRRLVPDKEGYERLRNDSVNKYRELRDSRLMMSMMLEDMSRRLGKPYKDSSEKLIILTLTEYIQNENDRKKVIQDLEKGKVSKKLKDILKTAILSYRAAYEQSKADAARIENNWELFFIERNMDIPEMVNIEYIDTVSNPYFYDNVYKAVINEDSYEDDFLRNIIFSSQHKGWEWYPEELEKGKYEEISESYPHSITYKRFYSHPQYRFIKGMAFDKDGNLLRVTGLDNDDDDGPIALPKPDYHIWRQNFDQHAEDGIAKQIAILAYQANDYDIHSKGAKVNHYIKNQLGLEALTKAEKARSDRDAKKLANAFIGAARDEMRYGRHSRKGRAAQNKHAAAALGVLLGGGGDYYSSEGAAWLTQIFDDYWKYFNDRIPYRFERVDDKTIKTVYVDNYMNPTFEIVYSYVQTGPFAVKENIKVNRLKGGKVRTVNDAAASASVAAADIPAAVDNSPGNGEIYVAVEEQAEFPGGREAMLKWLNNNVRYPESAQQNNTQGRVIVRIVVEKDGSVGEATIVKSVDKDLDREALRVAKIMPKWKPGKNHGVAVRSYYNFPVSFKLQNR